jgi:hypothetical protein
MKTVNLATMNKLDHADVKDLGGSTEKSRKKYRLGIIKNFLKFTKKDKERFNENNEERIALKRQMSFQRALGGFGLFANFFMYQAFLTGIYNYRQRELLNMRAIPFPLKVGLSSLVSGLMCYSLYTDNLYDENLYSIAVKYRAEFDHQWIKNEEKNKLQGVFA